MGNDNKEAFPNYESMSNAERYKVADQFANRIIGLRHVAASQLRANVADVTLVGYLVSEQPAAVKGKPVGTETVIKPVFRDGAGDRTVACVIGQKEKKGMLFSSSKVPEVIGLTMQEVPGTKDGIYCQQQLVVGGSGETYPMAEGLTKIGLSPDGEIQMTENVTQKPVTDWTISSNSIITEWDFAEGDDFVISYMYDPAIQP